jgi:hypothetical protein
MEEAWMPVILTEPPTSARRTHLHPIGAPGPTPICRGPKPPRDYEGDTKHHPEGLQSVAFVVSDLHPRALTKGLR